MSLTPNVTATTHQAKSNSQAPDDAAILSSTPGSPPSYSKSLYASPEALQPLSHPSPSPQLHFSKSPQVTVVTKLSPIRSAKSTKSALAIFRQLLLVADGRDKTLKVIQYFVKILFWAHLSQRKKRYPLLYQRLSALASNFSTTRKIIRLGHVVEPYSTFLTYANGEKTFHPDAALRDKLLFYTGAISAIFNITNDLVDDAYCLGRIGAFDLSIAKITEPISARLWFTCIWIDMYENLLQSWGLWEEMEDWKRRLKNSNGMGVASPVSLRSFQEWDEVEIDKWDKIKEKMFWLNFSLVKLTLDAGFCSCDIYQWRSSEGIQAWTGFLSAVMSGYKLWYKCSRS